MGKNHCHWPVSLDMAAVKYKPWLCWVPSISNLNMPLLPNYTLILVIKKRCYLVLSGRN